MSRSSAVDSVDGGIESTTLKESTIPSKFYTPHRTP